MFVAGINRTLKLYLIVKDLCQHVNTETTGVPAAKSRSVGRARDLHFAGGALAGSPQQEENI